MRNFILLVMLLVPVLSFAQSRFPTRPGQPLPRLGDEIVVCGQLFHTSASVVLWEDPGGYDAYRIGKRFADSPGTAPTQPSYSTRTAPLTDAEIESVRGGNWTLPFLQDKVDQFVIHYDVDALSRQCFRTLHDVRGLSVQFMLDIDGTLYQTMDLKDEAWHATSSNGRSIGIEVANAGAYPVSSSPAPLAEWYSKDAQGTRITIPARLGDGGVRTPNFIGRPSRPEMVLGFIQGQPHRQFDFTPQQYDTLIKLTATLCTIFPKITCDYPRQKSSLGPPSPEPTTQPADTDMLAKFTALAGPTETGQLIPHVLAPDQLENYQGVLGHYHVQLDKKDPGPAFQWDRVILAAALMSPQARAANLAARGHPAKFIPSKP